MVRQTKLASSHYAGGWAIPEEDQRNDLKAINQLGLDYAKMPDSPEKEAKLLQILECFHAYLMKVRGDDYPGNDSSGE